MDSNQTRFHLLLGAADWLTLENRLDAPSHAEWDQDQHGYRLAQRAFQFTASKADRLPELSARRGAARDRYGNWYWIADSGDELLVNSSGDGLTSHFWASSDLKHTHNKSDSDFAPEGEEVVRPLLFSGLTVTEDHYLVVGVLEPQGFLVFDLHSGGSPRQFCWPTDVPFEPFDFTPMHGGGLLMLDRTNGVTWMLDRFFQIVPMGLPSPPMVAQPEAGSFFTDGNVDCEPSCIYPLVVTPEWAAPVLFPDAIAIESLPDNSLLVLYRERPFSKVGHFRNGELQNVFSLEAISSLIETSPASRFTLVAHDFAFARTSARDRTDHWQPLGALFVVGTDGNQGFRFEISQSEDGSLRFAPSDEYFPMRLFGGKALVAAGTEVYYDFGSGWVPLVRQKRRRFVTEAVVQSRIFDGAEPNCVWHRALFDGCVPPESAVELWTRCADESAELLSRPWRKEPQFYRRPGGSELPFWPNSARQHAGTWEVLLQQCEGRYFQFRLRLSSNGQTSPTLRAMRIYYPRFSYLKRYLPAVYQEDRTSASFLERFLANPEGMLTTFEDKIASVQALLDPRTAPDEALPWLAGWLGIVLDPAWDERRRRLFLRHAIQFFQYRGTRRGLQMALRLAFEENPGPNIFSETEGGSACARQFRIVERFRHRRTPAVALEPPGSDSLLSVNSDSRWMPSMGGAELHRRYRAFISTTNESILFPLEPPTKDLSMWREFLQKKYTDTPGSTGLSKLNTAHGASYSSIAEADLPNSSVTRESILNDYDEFTAASTLTWQQFSLETLEFVPTTGTDDRERWQAFLVLRYPDEDALNRAHQSSWSSLSEVELPKGTETSSELRQDWSDFVQQHGLFGQAQLELWQSFLQRRYHWVGRLNALYQTSWKEFEEIPLPAALPMTNPALRDWVLFESIAIRMREHAHRFSVLLPVKAQNASDRAKLRQQLEWASRIVSLEKPAHTVFDVKLYWAFFCVGEARLGEDTQLGQGSRAPELLPPLILGESYLAESHLAARYPFNLTERKVLK